MSSTPANAWNTLLQPFYILSTVIGVLIALIIVAFAISACIRRRAIRRRFTRAIDAGWAIPVFNVSEEVNADLEAKSAITGPKPVMLESVLNMNANARIDDEMLEHALPLSMALLPTPSTRPHELLLYLLRSPSILTSNIFSRLRAIRFVRSEQSHYPQRTVVPPPTTRSSQEPTVEGKNSISSQTKRKEPPLEIVTEPVQVMFVIAMPNPPPPIHLRNSPSTAHEPAIPIANQELCIGALAASLQVPVQYIKGRRDDQVVGIRHGPVEVLAEEEEGDYASTVHTRRPRSEDPGHEFAGSFVSSRRLYMEYGDEGSSYMPHRTASVTPSYMENATAAGGSTHETHNSYLAPPSFGYGAYNHGPDDSSSVENHHHRYSQEPTRSQESSIPPSRIYTASIQSGDLPPATHSSSLPPPSSLPRSFLAPRVVINDPDEPSMLHEETSHQSNKSQSEQVDLAAHRVSQVTSWTDTTASATDVEGGYEADVGGARRLSLRPKATARRRAGV